MQRPVVYDVTHILHRTSVEAVTGIDRIDLAFGGYFEANPAKLWGGVHYGLRRPQFISAQKVGSLVRRANQARFENRPLDEDEAFARTRARLLCRSGELAPIAARDGRKRRPQSNAALTVTAYLRYMKLWGSSGGVNRLPENALYLNVAQHAFEFPGFFEWISRRPDVRCAFFVHDLLPLDYPEFWPAGHETIFEKRVATIARHATALLTTSVEASARICAELARRGRPPVPVFTRAFPTSFSGEGRAACHDLELFREPYFVVLGTIEPRKNHLLLLNIWRELARRNGPVPKLVVAGRRGWENEQTIDMIERCEAIRPHVVEVANLTNAGLCRLLANARALLMPSFAEGYGLPLVEALGFGTPVIASDIPVFRETTGGRAIFRHPLDGIGWMEAILELANKGSEPALKERLSAPPLTGCGGEAYFKAVMEFLASL